MTTVAAFIGQCTKAPEALVAGQRSALMACAKVAQQTMDKSAPSHIVGGKTIRVTDRIISAESASVKWGPPGWVRILNDRTEPHFIGPRSGRKRRQGSLRKQSSQKGSARAQRMANARLTGGLVGEGTKGAIHVAGVNWRAWAFHPGTPGKHFVEAGKAAAVPLVQRTYQRVALTEPMKAVFHG